MTNQCLIFAIQSVPGDEPRAVEQLNGDLLLPCSGRPVLEQALLMAEEALGQGHDRERSLLADARRLLGVVKVDKSQQTLQANLLKVRAI